MSARVHATAVVDPSAELAAGVVVGPHCVIGAGVRLGQDCELVAHAVLLGPARLGKRNVIHPFATLGSAPQDKSWLGEATLLEIGDDNVFREQVTLHRGTEKGGGTTRIGSRCLFMVGAHVAHDCRIGDDVVLTNLATLGGHVSAGDRVVCGGHVAVAPFVRLGRGCFLAGGARVERDIPPFVIAAGDRARVRAPNSVGLRRMGVPEASRRAVRTAFSILFRSRVPLAEAIGIAEREVGEDPYVVELVEFLQA
jgi:UDP-N-acetylglucosamine acyltransferase